MKSSNNGYKIAAIVLGVLLVFAVGYLLVDKIQENREQQMFSAYQQGAQEGYEQAVIQLAQQLATCQQVPINVGNQTINAVAVECLQQQQPQPVETGE